VTPVKPGGSVITDKEKESVPRKRVIDRLARKMRQSGEGIVVVYGVGSLGT